MNAIRQLLKKVKSTGTRLAGQVKTVSMGRERVFEAYNLGDDTFVFERGVSARLAERPSVLVVDRRWLRRRGRGKVMTVTTGNHAVAAMPLLDMALKVYGGGHTFESLDMAAYEPQGGEG